MSQAQREEADIKQESNDENANNNNNNQTNMQKTQTTPDNGRVVFEDMPIGEYTVTINHPDYKTIESTEVLDEDCRAPIYELQVKPSEPSPENGNESTPTAEFVVNAISEDGVWKEDGIEDTEITLTLEKEGNIKNNNSNSNGNDNSNDK